MEIKLKIGIDQLVFGMQRKDVVEIYGLPDKQNFDEEGNELYFYNKKKWILTFYEEEDFRLSFIMSTHPDLELFGQKIIGQKVQSVKDFVSHKGIKKFELEDFDLFEHHFNEENWFILNTEFNEVVKLEMGALIKDDEFEWRF